MLKSSESRKRRLGGINGEHVKQVESEARERYRNKLDYSNSPRKKWTAKEEELLISWKGSEGELASKLKRNINSIQIKRSRLRKETNLPKLSTSNKKLG